MTPLQRLQVFMLYPNAIILHDGKEYTLKGIDLKYFSKYVDLYGTERKYDNKRVRIDLCQLILRGIDQLTEEEKMELAEKLKYAECTFRNGL